MNEENIHIEVTLEELWLLREGLGLLASGLRQRGKVPGNEAIVEPLKAAVEKLRSKLTD